MLRGTDVCQLTLAAGGDQLCACPCSLPCQGGPKAGIGPVYRMACHADVHAQASLPLKNPHAPESCQAIGAVVT